MGDLSASLDVQDPTSEDNKCMMAGYNPAQLCSDDKYAQKLEEIDQANPGLTMAERVAELNSQILGNFETTMAHQLETDIMAQPSNVISDNSAADDMSINMMYEGV